MEMPKIDLLAMDKDIHIPSAIKIYISEKIIQISKNTYIQSNNGFKIPLERAFKIAKSDYLQKQRQLLLEKQITLRQYKQLESAVKSFPIELIPPVKWERFKMKYKHQVTSANSASIAMELKSYHSNVANYRTDEVKQSYKTPQEKDIQLKTEVKFLYAVSYSDLNNQLDFYLSQGWNVQKSGSNTHKNLHIFPLYAKITKLKI